MGFRLRRSFDLDRKVWVEKPGSANDMHCVLGASTLALTLAVILRTGGRRAEINGHDRGFVWEVSAIGVGYMFM